MTQSQQRTETHHLLRSSKSKRTVLLVLLLLVLLGNLGLTIWLANTLPPANHEDHVGYMFPRQHEPRFPALAKYTSLESNGWLYYALTVDFLADKPPAVMRSVSLICGWLSLVAVFALGYEFGGARTGLFCSFALGYNCFHLAIATHNRFYACNELFCVLSLWCLVKLCRSSSWRWWILYAISLYCQLLTMVLSALLLPLHVALAYWHFRRQPRPHADKNILAVMVSCAILLVGLCYHDSNAWERFSYNYEAECPQYSESLLRCLDFFLDAEAFTSCRYVPDDIDDIHKFAGLPLATIVLLLSCLPYCFCPKRQTVRCALVTALILLAVLFLFYSLSMCTKNVCNNTNYSFLVPLIAIMWGTAMTASRPTRILALCALLLAAPRQSCNTLKFYAIENPSIISLVNMTRPQDMLWIDDNVRWLHHKDLYQSQSALVAVPIENNSFLQLQQRQKTEESVLVRDLLLLTYFHSPRQQGDNHHQQNLWIVSYDGLFWDHLLHTFLPSKTIWLANSNHQLGPENSASLYVVLIKLPSSSQAASNKL